MRKIEKERKEQKEPNKTSRKQYKKITFFLKKKSEKKTDLREEYKIKKKNNLPMANK